MNININLSIIERIFIIESAVETDAEPSIKRHFCDD